MQQGFLSAEIHAFISAPEELQLIIASHIPVRRLKMKPHVLSLVDRSLVHTTTLNKCVEANTAVLLCGSLCVIKLHRCW